MKSIKQKLSEFNRNEENISLIEYLSKTNIFETIGKSRSELTALPDVEDQQAPKGFSIMAASAEEKQLVRHFMSQEGNRILVNSSAAIASGEDLFCVHELEYLSAEDAIEAAVRSYTSTHSKLESLRFFYYVIGRQKGNYPFLIYSQVVDDDCISYLPHNYRLWKGELFASVKDAVVRLLPVYISEGNDLSDFSDVYPKRGGNSLVRTDASNEYTPCTLFDNSVCYVNNSCEYYMARINEVLESKGFPLIESFSSEEYEQLVATNEWTSRYCKVPKNKYKQLGNTGYYYRRSGIMIDRLLESKELGIEKITNRTDYELLSDFYDSHRALIISVKKILLDDIPDAEERILEEKVLRRLLDNTALD